MRASLIAPEQLPFFKRKVVSHFPTKSFHGQFLHLGDVMLSAQNALPGHLVKQHLETN